MSSFGATGQYFAWLIRTFVIFTRDNIYAIARIIMLSPVGLHVYHTVTRLDQSETVEARIMHFSP